MSVHVLPSRLDVDVRANLAALVERARKLQVFGPTVDFDSPMWDLSDLKMARPTAVSAQSGRLYFATADNDTAKGMEDRTPFTPAFAGLMKALVVLGEHERPKGVNRHKAILRAARELYEVTADRGHDPADLTSDDFVKAAASFRRKAAQNTQYSMGQKLRQIAEAVNRHRVSKVRIAFSNPNRRPLDELELVDEEARARGAEKMASDATVDAIISMSLAVRERGDERDRLYAAATELLMCAPWRINEALTLLVDCERREMPKSEGPEDSPRFGIAYQGSKGFGPSIKWIPTSMTEIAERALADIRRITKPARKVAKFMEDHPGRAWLPGPWLLADTETKLTSADICRIAAVSSPVVGVRWAKENGVPVVERRGSQGFYRLADVERAILALQPKLPPGSPPLSRYLFLLPKRRNRRDGEMLSVVTFVTDCSFADFLAGRLPGRSVFERLDIRDAGGTPYRVRSHQIRHFLNNLAQEGRLSQLDIARWSGRKDMAQNAVYDHTGGIPLARTMREMLGTPAMQGPIADTYSRLPPIERAEFAKSRISTAHRTDIGACIQDWSLAPCPNHGSCADCGDHVVIKGDVKQRERARRLLDEYEPMLAQAEAEAGDGTVGAGNWVVHNRRMVEGLKRVLAIHDDVSIPDGTLVQVSDQRGVRLSRPV